MLKIHRFNRTCVVQDPTGLPMEDKHGEVLLQVCDLHLTTVANHNGDPNLQYLNITCNKGDVYHQGLYNNHAANAVFHEVIILAAFARKKIQKEKNNKLLRIK